MISMALLTLSAFMHRVAKAAGDVDKMKMYR